MLRLDLSPESLGRTRFGYSPLGEVASSVRVLQSAEPPRLLRSWTRETRRRLDPAALALLESIVPAPPHHFAPELLFARSWSAGEPIEAQLDDLRALPSERLADDVRRAWHTRQLPTAGAELLSSRDLVARTSPDRRLPSSASGPSRGPGPAALLQGGSAPGRPRSPGR